MNINNYIKDLLYLNDCVIIQGFGGFVTHYKPSSISASGDKIAPPSKDVAFNNVLKYNGELLHQAIANEKEISITEAEKLAEEFVNQSLEKLKKGEKIHFDGLGYCYMDTRGEIQFEPNVTVNLLAESYGLDEVSLLEIENDGSNLSETPIDSTIESTVYKKQSSGKWRTVAIYLFGIFAAICILGFVAFLFDIFPFNDQQVKDKEKSMLQLTFTDVASEGTGLEETIDKQSTMKDALYFSDKQGNDVQKEEIPQPEFQPRYYIIAGSFVNYENAVSYMNRIAEEGYEPEILTRDNRFRVTYKSFNDRNLALRELERIRNEKSNQSVWLLSI